MDDLTMDLVRLCRRNRDGSFGTQTNRQRGLTAIADELRHLGYKLPGAASLKPKHIEALIEKWHDDDKTHATIRNRLSWLRWWAEKANKANVIHRDNDAYGVGERVAASRNRAFALDRQKTEQIGDPHIKASLMLQAHFGLRREEAMKFRPCAAVRGHFIVLQGSWTKGGKPRSIPITTTGQYRTLQHIRQLVTGSGSFIPNRLSYVEHMRRYEYETAKAGLRNTHGLRHGYAQRRYQMLTGHPCPLAGGKRWKEMLPAERVHDRAARRQISAELGHGRLKITDIYLGSAFDEMR